MKVTFGFLATIASIVLVTLGLLGLVIVSLVPNVETIRECIVTTQHKVNLCPKNKGYVRISSVSKSLIEALIVSEDASFYSHSGFDWSELANSFERNLESGRYARGGSTLTQQLAKNVFLTNEKTITRKVREALIAIQLERKLTKNEILEKYLNVVQFGAKTFGVSSASYLYFEKHPSQLNWAESAFLVHLLPNPKSYSQNFLNSKLSAFNKKRISSIIESLYKYKRINQATYMIARDQLSVFFNQFSTVEDSELDLPSDEFDDSTEEEIYESEPLNKSTEDLQENSGFEPNQGANSQEEEPGSSSEFDESNIEEGSADPNSVSPEEPTTPPKDGVPIDDETNI